MAVDGSALSRPRAGMGTYTREILAAMLTERPQARFTLFLPRGAGSPLAGERVAVRPIPSAKLWGRHAQWPARLRRLSSDAFFGPAGQLPLGRVGSPSVVTIHDLAIYLDRSWFPGGQWLSTRLVVPRSAQRADLLIAVSQSTAEDLQELFDVPPERIRVVHEGVAARFRPLEPGRLVATRERLGLPRRFILFVGTIEPRKNLLTLLEAWAMLRDRPPLVVAGGYGWRYQDVQSRIERLGSDVAMLGEVDPEDLPALYNLAACLAHPAWYEGFGLTPLEAMACGTPVVATNTSSLPEVVGQAGILLDPGDAQAWTAALERVLVDPDVASDLRRRGVLRAAEFSWARAAEATWRAIESVVTG